MYRGLRVLLVLCFIPLTTFAQETYVAGTDYQLLPQAIHMDVDTPDKVTVTEFFSYGCPWCYKLEPALTKWRETKAPKNMTFTRVPVVFEKGWDIYAKAYYTADTLKINKKITPALFDAIQEKEKKLDTVDAMVAFFVKQGVDKKIALSAFKSSPAIEAKMRNGIQLMQTYRVFSVPSLVIGGRYKVDIAMVKGDQKKFFKVVNYLIAKSATED